MPKEQERPFQKILTPEETQFIRDNWHAYTLEQLAFKLDRNKHCIRFLSRKERFKTEISRWTIQEVEYLKDNMDKDFVELCRVLKRHKKPSIKLKKAELTKRIRDGY